MAFIFQSDKRKGRLNLVRHKVSFEKRHLLFSVTHSLERLTTHFTRKMKTAI